MGDLNTGDLVGCELFLDGVLKNFTRMVEGEEAVSVPLVSIVEFGLAIDIDELVEREGFAALEEELQGQAVYVFVDGDGEAEYWVFLEEDETQRNSFLEVFHI